MESVAELVTSDTILQMPRPALASCKGTLKRHFYFVTPWRSGKGVVLTFLDTLTTDLPPNAKGRR